MECHNNIDHLLKPTYWQGITINNGFLVEVENVFLHLWQLNPEWSWSCVPTKKSVLEEIAKFICDIKLAAAKGRGMQYGVIAMLGCSTDQQNELKEKDEYDILAFFVKVEKATKLDSLTVEARKLMGSVIEPLASEQEIDIMGNLAD